MHRALKQMTSSWQWLLLKNNWRILLLGLCFLCLHHHGLSFDLVRRLAESDAKMKALVVEHTEKVAALNAKLEEASKKAKENASKGTSADVNAFTLEILELR